MFATPRSLFAILLFAFPILLQSQNQCSTAPVATYTLTAASGSPVPENSDFSYTRKNDTDLLIRLEDINPYSFKCTASTSSADYKETAVASFLGTVGGVANVGITTPDPGAKTAAPSVANNNNFEFRAHAAIQRAPANPCVTAYMNGPHAEAEKLGSDRDGINNALTEMQRQLESDRVGFNQGITGLRRDNSCNNIVNHAMQLAFPTPTPTPVPNAVPIDQRINQRAIQAKSLLAHITDSTSACKADLQSLIDQDTAFLEAVSQGSAAAPSAVDTWRSQLKALNTVRANIVNAQASIASVLSSRQNFTIDTSIHGNQQVVTYTATCTPIPPQIIAAPDPAAVSSTTPTPPAAPPSSGGGATPAPVSNSWKHDFKFGPGPRFVLAGGLVISPLQQVTFSTTATPGGSGATANTIIQQQNSSTRLLPIAMLHARFLDMVPADEWKSWVWFPNYFSVGVTAKSSDNKGTNVEYLFGPSWAFADRQLFITAGAYAGQQQRLANSLTVGSMTSLSSANLPITQTTIWKVGFAITWAPAGK
jgi:hypothetical protein